MLNRMNMVVISSHLWIIYVFWIKYVFHDFIAMWYFWIKLLCWWVAWVHINMVLEYFGIKWRQMIGCSVLRRVVLEIFVVFQDRYHCSVSQILSLTRLGKHQIHYTVLYKFFTIVFDFHTCSVYWIQFDFMMLNIF